MHFLCFINGFELVGFTEMVNKLRVYGFAQFKDSGLTYDFGNYVLSTHLRN